MSFSVVARGQNVRVPDTPVAKLMYYLDSVCNVVDYNDNNIQRYRDCSNWASMSDEEDKLIFLLALALSPRDLEGRVFFNKPEWCPGCNNQFYEIGQVRHQLIITPSVIIGGRSRQVRMIMAYRAVWMQENYFQPIQALVYRFSPQGQREEAARRAAVSEACVIS